MRLLGPLTAAVSVLAFAVPALAQVQVPTQAPAQTTSAAPPPPAQASAPTAAPSTPAPAAATTPAPRRKAVVLRIGSHGAAVKDLQRELRRRGIKIAVDGAFGPATKRAVKRIQKRFGMRPTGVADAKLLKRLGLRVRTTAAARVVRPAVQPGRSPYLDVFPLVGDYSYSASYGDARHQGRHEGVDIMADRGTPIVAVVDAKVSRLTRTETGLGGIYVWLEGVSGTEYYYAHMNAIATGLQAGQSVSAGQVIGTVGNTGDARYGATHLHFEIRPGGRPTDPYPHLVAVDPTAR